MAIENLEPKTRFEYFLNKIAESGGSSSGDNNNNNNVIYVLIDSNGEASISPEPLSLNYDNNPFFEFIYSTTPTGQSPKDLQIYQTSSYYGNVITIPLDCLNDSPPDMMNVMQSMPKWTLFCVDYGPNGITGNVQSLYNINFDIVHAYPIPEEALSLLRQGVPAGDHVLVLTNEVYCFSAKSQTNDGAQKTVQFISSNASFKIVEGTGENVIQH